MRIDRNTPLWQLTVGEFLEVQKEAVMPQTVIQQHEKKFVHGLEGIEQIFG